MDSRKRLSPIIYIYVCIFCLFVSLVFAFSRKWMWYFSRTKPSLSSNLSCEDDDERSQKCRWAVSCETCSSCWQCGGLLPKTQVGFSGPPRNVWSVCLGWKSSLFGSSSPPNVRQKRDNWQRFHSRCLSYKAAYGILSQSLLPRNERFPCDMWKPVKQMWFEFS